MILLLDKPCEFSSSRLSRTDTDGNLNVVVGFRASFPGGDLKFKVKELFTCKVHNEGRMGDSVFVSAVIV